ncbi:MAG: hypothetical protein SGJ27_22575 [Candidatus Melainabacteria bacterium]|nr:hypothetical protein [Candidatus Melainabacteria bacterium]
MVQTLPKRYQATSECSSASTESVGTSVQPFVDNELLTSENVLVTARQRENVQQPPRKQRPEAAGSYTTIAGQVIAFPGFEDSIIGITEGDLREEQVFYETHDRDLVVTHPRSVIFSKEISIDPKAMRRLQPRIIIEDGYRSRDDD